MAIFSGPKVVNDGLVLHLDAANIRSYPKTGLTWKNSKGSGDNTLINGVTYSSSNLGIMVFDGVDDAVNFTAPNLGTTTTVVMWVKLGASYSNKMFFGWSRYDVYCPNGEIGFNTAGGDCHGISASTATSLGVVNAWKHYVFEMRSDVSYTNNKIYVNTIRQSLTQLRGTEGAANRNFNGGAGRIAGWLSDNNYRMPMSCGKFSVYNRALTETEIQQNFEATRSRYGI